ncbi:hypothetical protein BIV60_24760 [Bacillus sp. MUM 116]|uniref:hypothetical protein n=1 Tax=Bacillus sp. MUM 116 TaxID=1678002 RepID=UPI0008F5A934|nr:hypothetical protein [Bacillus sp. MUM 116]OIK09155.1 hypothetical protein BIV60_24760 [Bacillus sp. MUM 116]
MNDLEFQLRKLMDDYFEMDGYALFYRSIETLQAEGILNPFQNNQFNGKTPALPLYCWINIKVQAAKWDCLEMMKLIDRYDFFLL